MLSYQHIYHAGNFADIQKHAILTAVMKAMRLKPQPMAVLDTHAGRGIYDLGGDEAQKNREFDNGITHFWRYRKDNSPLRDFFDIITDINGDTDTITRYPGSSMIARKILKTSERLIAVERHPGEIDILKQNFDGIGQCVFLQKDGLQTIADELPFSERRGIVITDPSYEIKTDYREVPRAIMNALKKNPQTVFFLWYPILDNQAHLPMLTDFRRGDTINALISEIRLEKPPTDHYRMSGSGIMIINPPWPETTLDEITQYVATRMPVKTFGDVYWLDNLAINVDTGMIAR